VLLGLALASGALACSRGGDVERLAARLGPGRFGTPDPAFHGPVVQLGDEARPVVAAPRPTVLVERRGVPVRDGVARVTAVLPPEGAAAADRDPLVLSVQRVDPGGHADEIALGAATLHFVRRDAGWRVRRDGAAGERVSIEVDEPQVAPDVRLNVRLEAVAPPPHRLVSAKFDFPPRSRLVLGYGVAQAVPAPAGGAATFRATLSCPDATLRVLLERTAALPEGALRWYDASVALPSRARRCRLGLESSGASGVWSVPEVWSRDQPSPVGRRNVVLISLDTLRADHLSAYGYGRPTSPAIDARIAARGATFLDVSTTFPLTSPAHMSLFTGLYAGALPRLGILDPWTPARTLAEVLGDAGFATGAFTEDALLAGSFGFWFGFDRFVERPLVAGDRGTATFADGARFLRANRERPFFLFLHTYKVHAPYASSPAYASFFTDQEARRALAASEVPPAHHATVDAYDRALRELDDQVAGFLRELARLGLDDETYVVLLSDHGEAFGEHGLLGHGFGAHQEQLRIPLLIRGPGVPAGVRVATPASIVDVAPTILDLLGLPPFDADGASLRATLSGSGDAGRALRFQWLGEEPRGVRRGRYKLLAVASGSQLFDLRADPGERRPLEEPPAGAPTTELIAGGAEKDAARRARLAAAPAAAAPPASPRVVESMRALGYVE